MSPVERLLTRAIRLESGCLVLPNHEDHPELYATVKVDKTTRKAHRVVYEAEHGPTDKNVCHTCDYPRCFELSHLFEGTQSDNMKDMHTKGRAPGTLKRSEWDIEGEKNPNWKGGVSSDKAAYHRAWRLRQKNKEN